MERIEFRMEREKDVSIFVCSWQPQSTEKVKGVIQLAHGMAEHILRYDDFSKFLVKHGYIVYGNDHRGHGNTIIAPDDQGYFAKENGFEKVVGDLHALTLHIKNEHPNLPLILFGHSMGSFLSRRYIQLYGNDLDGVILSGTGADKGILGKIGYLIAKWERFRKGPRTPSPLMNQLSFGNFNKAFSPARTEFDFLSRDKNAVDTYIKDKKCGFICSTSFYMDLIKGIEIIHQSKESTKIPKQLPMYIISGDMDPVGDYGKGVQNVFRKYKQLGLKDVRMRLYPKARHELLHEQNKTEVYQDILIWLEQIVSAN